MALALGKTAKEIRQEMDSDELSEWIAYMNIEPIPDEWSMHAQQCSLFASAWFKGNFPPAKFMPNVKRPRESAKEIGHKLEIFAKRHNANRKDKKP